MSPPKKMTPLLNQLQFEALLRPGRPTSEDFFRVCAPIVGVAFGAEWCGPCKRLDKDKIVDDTPGVKWYYCDVDKNDYTLGYCGLQAIPSFVLILDGIFYTNKLSGASSEQEVVNWVKTAINKKVLK